MNTSDLSQAIQIIDSRISKLETTNPTLFSGLGGKTLLYSYLNAKSANAIYENLVTESIQNILDNLSVTRQNPSLSDGYAGVAWTLQHLLNEGLVTEISTELISGFDEPVSQSIPFYYQQKNYDLLYGAIGSGLYFLERGEVGVEGLHSVINLLAEISIKSGEGISWYDQVSGNGIDNTPNLGLSHGIPGIIIFLSKSYEFIKQSGFKGDPELLPLLTDLITKSVQWMIVQEKPIGASLFPNDTRASEESRLGWSYGDLGVALCLAYAGKILKNSNWIDLSLKIGIHTIDRTVENSHMYLDYELIPDAGICNGSSGVALMYRSLYDLTNNQNFADRSEFWKLRTVNSVIEAYETYGLENAPVSQTHWWNDLSLIKGLSGIGLSLMGCDPFYSDWKKCLLLI